MEDEEHDDGDDEDDGEVALLLLYVIMLLYVIIITREVALLPLLACTAAPSCLLPACKKCKSRIFIFSVHKTVVSDIDKQDLYYCLAKRSQRNSNSLS